MVYSKYSEPIICPDFEKNADFFIEFLLKVDQRLYSSLHPVLIPASDTSLIPTPKSKAILEQYYYPLTCDWKTTEKFINKYMAFIGTPSFTKKRLQSC
jgi:hypothetical protein